MADPLVIDPGETAGANAVTIAPASWQPYQPEKQRDVVRMCVTLGLLVSFLGLIFGHAAKA